MVTFATPFCVLPCKDSIEDIRGKKLVGYENFIWSLTLIIVAMLFSMALTNIGTIMTILGATTNSAIGFLLPIVFYLKSTKKAPVHRIDRVMAKFLFVFICVASVITMTMLVQKLTA